MKYILLIYSDEALSKTMTKEQEFQEYNDYNAFTKFVTDRGVNEGGEALHPISTATTVRVRDGKTMTTDGPFAETREQLGGYYIVNAKDLDEAIEIASKIPGAKKGSVEIRPVMIFE